MNYNELQEKISNLVAESNFKLRTDVHKLIKQAYETENGNRAKTALGWILDNARKASRQTLALCQDTGLPMVFIEAGKNRNISYSFVEAVSNAVASGYKKHYLRPSIVDPLIRGKPGYNGVQIYTDFNPGIDGIKITLLVKGFGSENKSALKMFDPTCSVGAIEDFVVDTVKSAGPESCPPFIVGVGIGATADRALLLSKKVLTGPLTSPNRDKKISQLEGRLFKRINRLNIGPMGFGGKNTVLSVKVEKNPTHIAGLPVGVNISCWALRSASIIL